MTKLKILIVEDEELVALALALAAEDLGVSVVGPVARVADALTLIENGWIDGAIIDAQLVDRDITPVALRLAEQIVPFVVYTGTGLPEELAATHPDTPVMMKPTRVDCVLRSLITRIDTSIKGE
jgi:DNA-binding response OmpR family regulator